MSQKESQIIPATACAPTSLSQKTTAITGTAVTAPTFFSQNKGQNNPVEIEIFRITPMHERLYETATYTRKTGDWPSEKYFTTNTPRFVGKFVKHCQIGYGDGAIHYDIFEKDGHKVRVDYSYDGTTCYREYDPLSQSSGFVVNPQVSKTPDSALFDLQHSSGPKPTCCIIS